MRAAASALLPAAVLLAAIGAAPAPAATVEARSAHYHLVSDGSQEDADDYTIAVVENGGPTVRVDRRAKGAWIPLAQPKAPPPEPGAPWEVAAVRTGHGVGLIVNGRTLGTYDLPGDSLGLAIDHCTVDFTDVRWE